MIKPDQFPKVNPVEQPDKQLETVEIASGQPAPQDIESTEVSMGERVETAVESLDTALSRRESGQDKRILPKIRRLVGMATMAAASLLAVGCGAEKPSVGKPEPTKVENSQDGFKDNASENAQRRLRIKQAEIKRMKEMKGYKPSKEAKDAAREMNENQIIQP